jgi:hypothetical protein
MFILSITFKLVLILNLKFFSLAEKKKKKKNNNNNNKIYILINARNIGQFFDSSKKEVLI